MDGKGFKGRLQKGGMIALFILFIFNLGYGLNVALINQQSYDLIDHMKRIEDFPQVLDGKRVKDWIREDELPKGRLFIKGRELKKEDLLAFMEKANIESIPDLVLVKFGWTLKRTNMRMYPSQDIIHKGNPAIDYNQYTLLEPFTPLAILHRSKDGEWLYVHAPYMRGWVRKEDVLVRSREELLKIIRMPFLVVVKNKVEIGGVVFGLGSKIPYVEKEEEGYRVLLPDLRTTWIKKEEGLSEGFLTFSEERARPMLEGLLGIPYDWGGKEGRWDCSSLVQSLYAVFGLELPRNSAQQAKIGRIVARSFSSYEEFKTLLKNLPPFRTLIFMKGHVMIYGGMEGGEPVIYHAVHSIIQEDGKRNHIGAIAKNYLERHRLRSIYRSIISVNVLD